MHLRKSSLAVLFALSTAALFACGGGSPPEAPTPSSVDAGALPSAAPAASAAPSGVPSTNPAASAASNEKHFDDLSKDEKVQVMRTKVVPNVGKLFKEYDPKDKDFQKFGCVNCHGPSMKDDPRNVLPKLTLSNGGFEKLAKAKPEIVKFMAEKVTPAMADALGEKPFDPATHKGFGCGGCHSVN
jgi:hypothetical protein